MSTLEDNKANDLDRIQAEIRIDPTETPLSSRLPPGRVRAIKLESVRDVRKFLSRLINKTYRDEVSPAKAGRLGQLAGIILKSIELTEIERRVSDLEKETKAHGESSTSG